jgi:PKD repeat protein
VTDNVISNTGRGGIFCNNDSTDNVIVRNVVGGSGGERLGIEAWGSCHRTLIEDNRIDHWLSLDGSDFCAVRRNTVSDKSGNYAWAGLEAICQNSVFTDNLVDGGAQVGISQSNWQTKEYLLFARNTIKASAMWGLLLGGRDGPCQYQYFYQNKFLTSIGAQPPAQYSGQGNGVYIDNNCYHMSFVSNEISYNYWDGIVPVGTRATQNYFSFTGNTIQNNGNGGVWDGFSTDLEWSGNTISGNHGGGSDWNAQLISRGFANQKPAAAFACPAVVAPGQSVLFTNTSSDADGTISRVLWDFGDGLPSTNFSPTHAYASTGLYTVALVVWDNGGRGMLATRTINVKKKLLVGTLVMIKGLAQTASAVSATGGTITDVPGYRLHTFTNVGTNAFNVTAGGNIEVLVVAGGGSGGGQDYVEWRDFGTWPDTRR